MGWIDWRAAPAPACLIGGGTFGGWVISAALSANQLTNHGYSMREGNLTTSLAVGLLFAFACVSLAQGLLIHRPRRRHARTAEQQDRSPTVGRRSRSRLEDQRRRQPTLQAILPEPVQVHLRGGQQHSQPDLYRPGADPIVQSHLLGVVDMPIKPTPRTPTPVVARMDGHGRGSAHGRVDMRLVLTFTYRPDRPYEVQIDIINARPQAGELPECWLVSREVLYTATMWQIPSGMCDFRASPTGEGIVQLVFTASAPEHFGQSLHVDVLNKSLSEFLLRTILAVPPGTESQHVDIDALLVELLNSDH